VQVGYSAERALLVRPPHPGTTTALVSLLRAMNGVPSLPELALLAEPAGLTPGALRLLMAELAGRGLLHWHGAPVHPIAPAVAEVHGDGPLSEALAQSLAAAKLVVRRSRGPRMAEHRGGTPPDVVILGDCLMIEPSLAAELIATRTPHLPVQLRDGTGVVGPLVLPGRTSCLRCADLHRSDRDPEWPALSAQLRGQHGDGSSAAVLATAAVALAQVELLLAGAGGDSAGPGSLNATLEVDVHRDSLCRRPWPAHPHCGCGAHP
jgi:bacteriocin biosynthesis cyclodehydratase domain-containing protein